MAYNNAIPQLTDKFSQSQADLLANFVAIQTFIEVNHVTFADADAGKHEQVEMIKTTTPGATADEIKMYTADMPGAPIAAVTAAQTGGPEMWLARTDGVNDLDFPVTAASMVTTGWCYLPSGMIVKWGTHTATSGGTTATYVAGNDIPVFKTVLSGFYAQRASHHEGHTMYINNLGTTGMGFTSEGGTHYIYYLAIGY